MPFARYSDHYETNHPWPRHRRRCRIVRWMCKERRKHINVADKCATLPGADEAGCDQSPAASQRPRRPRRHDAPLSRNQNTRYQVVSGVFLCPKTSRKHFAFRLNVFASVRNAIGELKGVTFRIRGPALLTLMSKPIRSLQDSRSTRDVLRSRKVSQCILDRR